uniref:Uncharacterized protein n=1 Tax=Arundo donax TaxID=35708 RepID=A0A0A9B7W0_ARUDO
MPVSGFSKALAS